MQINHIFLQVKYIASLFFCIPNKIPFGILYCKCSYYSELKKNDFSVEKFMIFHVGKIDK